jgi:hypothetical protein
MQLAGAEGYGSLARCIAEGAANALVGRGDENWATVQFAMWDAMMGGSPSAAAFAQASGQQVSTLYDVATLYAGSGGLTGGSLEGWNQYSSVPDPFDSGGRSLTCPSVSFGERTVLHHTVPSEVLSHHLPENVANDPLVRGRAGRPNRWPIPESLHVDIHRGRGGGLYNQQFIDRVKEIGPSITAQQVDAIRQQLAVEFGFAQYRPY